MKKSMMKKIIALLTTISMVCVAVISVSAADKQNSITCYDTAEPITATEVSTETVTKEPNAPPLKITATSNFFPEAIAEYDEYTKEVTVTYTLGLTNRMLNTEWYLTYDSDVLSFDESKNKKTTDGEFDIMPQVTHGAVYNTKIAGEINSNASSTWTYKVTDEQPFIKITFDVIGEGDTIVDLQVRCLTGGDLNENYWLDQNSIKQYVSQFEVFEVDGIAAPTKKTELTPSTFGVATEPTTDFVEETVPIDVEPRKIYFDVESTGWSGYKTIYCHIWRNDGKGVWPQWQTKKERCTLEANGLYSYDTTKTGNIINETDDSIYCVIFSNDDGLQIYPVTMSGSCIGDTVFVTGNRIESSYDSEKHFAEAAWRNSIDCGPKRAITSTGNVVGIAFSEGESDETLMADYLRKYYRDQTKMIIVQDLFDRLIIDTKDVLHEVKLKEDYAISTGETTQLLVDAEYAEIERILRRIVVSEDIIYDINKDKYTDIKDVTALQMYLASYDIKVKESKLDVNGDGIVDVKDVTALQLHLVA